MLQRRTTQLAVEILLLLALVPEGKRCCVRELASQLGAPASYLAKIVRDLTRLGFLRGVRGPGGGVRLARPAAEINLWEVVHAIEPLEKFERCVLRPDRCDDLHPCPLHEGWSPIREQITDLLKSKSLWELALAAQGSRAPELKVAAGDPRTAAHQVGRR
jgi:Rrf2 family transcriptional regulator, iron-sulfur cluster assembly transcription factor